MVTGSLTGKIGVEPILPVRRSVTKIQGKLDSDGDGVGMCKQAFSISRVKNGEIPINSYGPSFVFVVRCEQ